jgi:hypothetical protein
MESMSEKFFEESFWLLLLLADKNDPPEAKTKK